MPLVHSEVSHVGLNLDRHREDFKHIDAEDQQLVHDWLLSAPRKPPPRPASDERRRLLPEMIVNHELTLDRFLGDAFLEVSEDSLPDRVLKH